MFKRILGETKPMEIISTRNPKRTAVAHAAQIQQPAFEPRMMAQVRL